MVPINRIKNIGYGFGFGGTNANKSIYNKNHKKTLETFVKNLEGNFLDTSIIYGEGKSEKIIGKLDSKFKKKIFISTKVSPKDLSYQKFINSCLKSCRNLKVKTIDLIQPHWPNYDIDNDQIIDAFKFLKKNGKVRYFGLSNYDLKDIKYFKKKLKNDFRFIQEEYSLKNREVEDKFRFCLNNNLKIICYSPLSSGNLTLKKKEERLLKELSKQTSKPISSIILKFLLNRSNNLILIPHTSNVQHLKENITAKNINISKKNLNKINQIFRPKYISISLNKIIYKDINYKKIQSLEDAVNNKAKFSPSPKSLAKIIKKGYRLKSIKLKKINKKYYIKEGRLRFWAHVIAYGFNKKIRMLEE